MGVLIVGVSFKTNPKTGSAKLGGYKGVQTSDDNDAIELKVNIEFEKLKLGSDDERKHFCKIILHSL